MIDPADHNTQPLPLDQPKRGRGRPKTGQAMTAAQKQAAYRARQKDGNVTENTATRTTKSVELLRERALSRGRTCVAQARMIAELEKRVELAEARADAMGNELAIVKAQLSKPARVKRHRDQPAAELPDDDVPDAGVWTVQFKQKGQRTWISCDPQIDLEGKPWGYRRTRQHVLDMQKGYKEVTHWRAVRDDGIVYDPKAPK